jgi:tetratricopeptide (TPR) repeat protein
VGRYEEAVEALAAAVEAWRRTMPRLPDTFMDNLSDAYRGQGRLDDAESVLLEVLRYREQVLGPEHPQTLTSMKNLGLLRARQGRYAESEEIQSETLQMLRRTLGNEHYETLASSVGLANVYVKQGKLATAERMLADALETQRRVLGPRHAGTAESLYSLACLETARGDRPAAIRFLRRAVEAGYANAPSMTRDSGLAPLHDDPEFGPLVAEARSNGDTAPPGREALRRTP